MRKSLSGGGPEGNASDCFRNPVVLFTLFP